MLPKTKFSGNFQEQNNILEKKIYEDLLEKELQDEEIVKQYVYENPNYDYDNSAMLNIISRRLYN
jgi:ABC-type Fe3+/spermidine/putrescine transport system ATPase subunit